MAATAGEIYMEWVPDRQKMCRVCLEPNPVAKWSLFECTLVGQSIADVLMAVGGIQIRDDDNYPAVCCSGCLKDVEVAHKLRERFRESHRRLGQIFEVVQNMATKRRSVEEVEPIKLEPLNIEDEEDHSEGELTIDEGPDEPPAVEPDESSIITKLNVNNMEITIALPNLNELAKQTNVTKHKPIRPKPILPKRTKAVGNPKPVEVNEEPQRKAYECCGCTMMCKTEQGLNDHLEKVHFPRRVPPEHRKPGTAECYRCFRMVKRLREHHMKNERCKICGITFPTMKAANAHYKVKHCERFLKFTMRSTRKICCGCGAHFGTLGDLKIHSNQVHFHNRSSINYDCPFQCEICYANFPDYPTLHVHQTRFQKDNKQHQCPHCERTFFFLMSLRDHEKTHAG